jgi:hypothetical protein
LKYKTKSIKIKSSILSQKVPKFQLYKHNDELFNIYYVIFYELWTFADFDRLCKLEKRGLTDTLLKGDHLRIISAKFGWNWLSSFIREDFFLISSPLFSNLHNWSKSANFQSIWQTLQLYFYFKVNLNKSFYRRLSYCESELTILQWGQE